MDTDLIVDKLVAEYRADPRNKIIIEEDDLLTFASEELGTGIERQALLEAVDAYGKGTAQASHQQMVDAATALCHQVADRAWGKCINEDDDEYEEVDISTNWELGHGPDEGIAVVVRKM